MPDLLEYLQSQPSGTAITAESVERILQEIPDTLTPTELNALVKFASNQTGIWGSEWMFSPASSPKLSARTESERWSQLWESWLKTLSELAPEIKVQSERLHSLTVFQYHMEKRINYNKGKPILKLLSVSLSKIAFALNKLGLRGLAEHYYTLSLYPKDTIGRIN